MGLGSWCPERHGSLVIVVPASSSDYALTVKISSTDSNYSDDGFVMAPSTHVEKSDHSNHALRLGVRMLGQGWDFGIRLGGSGLQDSIPSWSN